MSCFTFTFKDFYLMVSSHIFVFIVAVSWVLDVDVNFSEICFMFSESTRNLSCFATG